MGGKNLDLSQKNFERCFYPLAPPCWCEARNACLIGRPIGTVLPPRNQIVERINVWRKAENDPTDSAPKNNSVTHHLPPN